MSQVSKNIDELIGAELEAHPERLVSFFARLQANYDEAIRLTTRFFLLMLAAWFLTYAIYAGLIDKIAFLGVELNRKMIVVSPFLVGLLSYQMLSGMAGSIVLWEALSRGVFHLLPTAWRHSFDDLLAPPTFSNVERMLEPRREKRLASLFGRAWYLLVTLLMFGGSLVALVHTTCLLYKARPDIHLAFGVVSVLLGAITWSRGVVLFASAIEATGGGGFNLGHHRGSGRVGVGGMPVPEQPREDSPPNPKPVAQQIVGRERR